MPEDLLIVDHSKNDRFGLNISSCFATNYGTQKIWNPVLFALKIDPVCTLTFPCNLLGSASGFAQTSIIHKPTHINSLFKIDMQFA